jgi:hypothetical protein
MKPSVITADYIARVYYESVRSPYSYWVIGRNVLAQVILARYADGSPLFTSNPYSPSYITSLMGYPFRVSDNDRDALYLTDAPTLEGVRSPRAQITWVDEVSSGDYSIRKEQAATGKTERLPTLPFVWCAECQTTMPADARFCIECGKQL